MQRTVSFAMPQELHSVLGPELVSDDFEVYLAEKGVQDLLLRVMETLSTERPEDPIQRITEFLQEAYPRPNLSSRDGGAALQFDDCEAPQSPVFSRSDSFESPHKSTPHRMRRREMDESMISEPDITVEGMLPRAPMFFGDDDEMRAMRRSSFCVVGDELAVDPASSTSTPEPSEKDFLECSMRKSWVAAQLNPEELEQVINGMEAVVFEKGTVVEAQGYLYVLQSGAAHLHADVQSDMEAGQCLGESNLYAAQGDDCEERFTVAGDLARFFRLSSSRFHAIISKSVMERRQRHLQLLSTVPLLSSLEQKRLFALADALQVRAFAPGQTVIAQGDRGSEFFLVEKGCAEVVHDGEAVGELHAGDYFGEIALLDASGKRAATVRVPESASGPLLVATIRRQVFTRLLGADVIGEMRKKAPMYKRTPKRAVAKMLTKM